MSDNAKRTQVIAQFRAVVVLCAQIAEVHTQIADAMDRGPHLDDLLDIHGKRSAGLIEHLGDVANGMDIVQPEDAWMEPIFDAAHKMFPETA